MRTTRFQYNIDGAPTKTEFWNGVTEVKQYDEHGRLASVEQLNSAQTTLHKYTYKRDLFGRIARVDELGGSATEYRYDAKGRLDREKRSIVGLGSTTVDYQYDAAGNRVRRVSSDGTITTFVYDSFGQLVFERTGSVETNYTYDLRGNLVSRSTSADVHDQLTWNAQGLLSRVRSTRGNSVTVVEYEYDHSGNRISRTEDGRKVSYLIDTTRPHSQVLAEYSAEGLLVSYTYGSDRISQTGESGTLVFLHDSHSGTRELRSEQNEVVASFRYDAFGNVVEQLGGNKTNALYRAEFRDPLTGFDNLRARNYDPTTGRFVSRDQVETEFHDLVNFSRYQYVGGDPVNRSDPSGEFFSFVEHLVAKTEATKLQQANFVAAIKVLTKVTAVLGGFSSAKEVRRRLDRQGPQREWKGEFGRFSADLIFGFEIGMAQMISGEAGGHYATFAFTVGASASVGFGVDNVVLEVPKRNPYSSGDLKGIYMRGIGFGLALGTSVGGGTITLGQGEGYFYSLPSTDIYGTGVFGIPKVANLGAGVDFLAFGWAWMMTPEFVVVEE
jgi:RHS repeat-associated protein